MHEDEAERTAEAIATFMRRFRIGQPPLQVPRCPPGAAAAAAAAAAPQVPRLPPVLPVAMGPAFERNS